jgi:hypothetical protein
MKRFIQAVAFSWALSVSAQVDIAPSAFTSIIAQIAADIYPRIESLSAFMPITPEETRKEKNSIGGSTTLAIRTTKVFGSFVVAYANLQSSRYPHGIRGTGGNGPNYVFKLDNGSTPTLVYKTQSAEMQNRIELIEEQDGLYLDTYAHTGFINGPQEPDRFKWNGKKFVAIEKKVQPAGGAYALPRAGKTSAHP